MAKTVSVDTIANVFADYDNVVILSGIGGENVDGVPATTYTAFVPAKCLEYLSALRTAVNNGWKSDSGRMFPKGASDSEKLALVPQIAASFEPSEPRTNTPLRRAAEEILCELNPNHPNAKLSGNPRRLAMEDEVTRFLNVASLEKFRSRIEAKLAQYAAETDKRTVRGAKDSETGTTLGGFDYETNDEVSQAAE